jgi:hypothetical protein
MADPSISDEELVAWIDGELSPEAAARVVEAVDREPALAARVAAHRRLATRMAAAFGPIAEEPAPLRPRDGATVISLAAVRAARADEARKPHRWALPGAVAASLLVGVMVGRQATMVASVDDRSDALVLATPIARALDGQLSGEAGTIRVSLSFRGKDGGYCRSFAGSHIDGIACHSEGGWRLRYAAPASHGPGQGYRMAGDDAVKAAVVEGLIAGDPLDAAAERNARAAGWK